MSIKRFHVEQLERFGKDFSGLTVFAVVFIRAVGTVPETVALPATMDTAAVVTLKLVRATGARSCRGNGKTESSHLTG